MALRNQPYLPLYVQDFLTDEKLGECSAKANGVYIRLMCLMHKSEDYGKILLKQKDKQTTEQIKNFALKIAKYLPYSYMDIEGGLIELLDEKVIKIEGDLLIQPRMVKDAELSEKRSLTGREGGKSTQLKNHSSKNKKFAKAKVKANTEYEIEYEDVIKDERVNTTGTIGVVPEEAKKINEHEIVYPWNSLSFKNSWDLWKDYKKRELKFYYKTPQSEQAALMQLAQLTQNESEAIEIINQSMANGWKGFFNLKINQNGTRTKPTIDGVKSAVRDLLAKERNGQHFSTGQ